MLVAFHGSSAEEGAHPRYLPVVAVEAWVPDEAFSVHQEAVSLRYRTTFMLLAFLGEISSLLLVQQR